MRPSRPCGGAPAKRQEQAGEIHGGGFGTASARAQYRERRADNQIVIGRQVAAPVTNTVRATRVAAALVTLFCILWHAGVPSWLGVADPAEQDLALMLGLSLCALFLSTRVSRAKLPYNALCSRPILSGLAYPNRRPTSLKFHGDGH